MKANPIVIRKIGKRFGQNHSATGQYGGKGMAIEIRDGVDYMEDVRTLIETYTNWLGLDLAFQNLRVSSILCKFCLEIGG